MSPEAKTYAQIPVQQVVKKDQAVKKAESYVKTASWSVLTNKRLSTIGYWRK